MKHHVQQHATGTAEGAGVSRQWSSIEELTGDTAFRAWVDAEYPHSAQLAPTARREFLKLMAASFALAGLTGCEKSPFVAALPYVDQSADVTSGIPKYYATAVILDGYAQPVIGTTWSGRPTKLDGNPQHPTTQGRSDVFMQAAVLGLYDPDRAEAPTRRGEPVTWGDVSNTISTLRSAWKSTQGEGLRLLLGPTTSPTLLRQLEAFVTLFPKTRVHLHEPMDRKSATVAAYGEPLDLHYALDECDVVVGLEDDFLGPGPNQVRNALAWSKSRRRHADQPGIQLHIAESVPSNTGAMAGSRVAVDASRMSTVAEALAQALGVPMASPQELEPSERRWIDRAAAACRKAKQRALVTAGGIGDASTAIWAARINEMLESVGKTLHFSSPIAGPAGAGALWDLIADMEAGRVDSLVIIETNPAYTTAAELGFADALSKVGTSIHIGLQRDETGALCDWQLPITHSLESWSDARAVDGRATIIQPLITPFYDVRSVHQIIGLFAGEIDPPSDAAVRETWQASFGSDFETRWRQALHDGFVEPAAAVRSDVRATVDKPAAKSADHRYDIVFRPDPHIWDGQFANNGWLQELPKPLTTLTWGNVIAISPTLAKRIEAVNGDQLRVAIGDRSVVGPAWIMPGQPANTIALYLGYGRKRAGRVGDEHGYDAYSVRPAEQPWITKGTLRKLQARETLAVAQLHHRMEGFEFVREVSAEHPKLSQKRAQPSLYPENQAAKHAWGMVIDLDSCIGCNACVSACTAENNVPVVGKDQVTIGREMHWLRVDRYYSGDIEAPRSFFQPVPCMHCEDAPCEMGCPVHATVHSPEGLNQMVYNRCIGTRTCSSFCPYKVRRFNFYDYRNAPESPLQAAHNPDVTLRSRGVMEKCTYCTQRIEAAHASANKENRAIADGEVVTACQGACPTRAISFGDLADPDSEVSRLRRDGRHYVLLEELGTRPRTTYLARWKDVAGDQEE